MAISSTFYLDSPSLSTATAIYSDINLTTIASDGFYSNGTISREQVSGILLPQVVCGSCATPCGGTINGSGNQGVYTLSTDLGTDTGAVVVSFDPFSVPDGIIALFNSSYYNGLSSPSFGWLQGLSGSIPTYIGDLGSDCGLVSNSPYTLNVYNYSGGSFVPTGGTETFSILSSQLFLTSGGPGNCKMVIPKTTASPSILSLKFIGPCSGTAFNIGVTCPVALTSFASSTMGTSSTLACADTVDQTYYVAHVNGSGGVLGLYDLVFSDINGEFKLTAGYYKTTAAGTNDWFRVDTHGVIIAFGVCVVSCECHDGVINTNGSFSYYDCNGVFFAGGAELGSEICYNINAAHSSNITDNGISAICSCGTPPAISYNCISGNCIDPNDGTGTYSTLAACEAACTPPPIESYDCIGGSCIDPGDGSGTYSTLSACLIGCGVAESYDCISGTCIDPGDGTGTYSTLASCEAVCVAPESYNCISGNCIDPGDGSGTYSTLAACEAVCTPPPPVSYNCVSGTCTDPGDGTGTYSTLAACQAACTIPITYNCTHFTCFEVYDGTGQFATLQECEALCALVVVSYNCVSGNCVEISGTSGTYPTLLDCEAACTPPPVESYNCVSGTCTDPGDGTGTYSTLAACEAACMPSLDWECVNLGQGLECVFVGGGTGTYSSLAQCQLDCAGA